MEFGKQQLVLNHTKNVSISPNSITEFAVSGDAGQIYYSEIIFGNNDLVIFEQEDGSGWN